MCVLANSRFGHATEVSKWTFEDWAVCFFWVFMSLGVWKAIEIAVGIAVWIWRSVA